MIFEISLMVTSLASQLELVDSRVLALLLVAYLGVCDRLAHRLRRLGQGIGAEIDHPRLFCRLHHSPPRVIITTRSGADD